MKPIVFLSVGSTFNENQEKYVQAIEQFMIDQGLNPQTVGRTYFSNQQPLRSIEDLLVQASGIAVLALERTAIETAVEKRNSDAARELREVKLPTVWNQIEAAMAYTIGLPLLVLVEKGIKLEGLLEPGYDWYVKTISIDRLPFDDREFLGIFESWKRSVQEYQVSMAGEGGEPAPVEIGTPKHLTQLRQILAEKFSEDELRTLVFDLGEDYESLPGSSKPVKAMELLSMLKRYDRLPDLIEVGQALRKDINWL